MMTQRTDSIADRLSMQQQIFNRNTTGIPWNGQATILTYTAFSALLNDAQRRGWVSADRSVSYSLNMSLADFNRAVGL